MYQKNANNQNDIEKLEQWKESTSQAILNVNSLQMQENPADTPKAIREENLNYKSHR